MMERGAQHGNAATEIRANALRLYSGARLLFHSSAGSTYAGKTEPPSRLILSQISAGIVIVARPRPRLAIGIFRIVSAGGAATAERMQSCCHLPSTGR
jgi:hypothetical protein